MHKKHKLLKEMHLNLHNSVFTFKEFLKVCQNLKAKNHLTTLTPETSGTFDII